VKKHFGTIIKFTASLGVGLFIVWFTFSKLTDEERNMMRSSFRNANYRWLIAGVMLNLTSNFFRTERWRMLLQPLGKKPGFLNTFLSVIAMYFANLLFPRLGEVMRCGILKKYEDIPVDKSIGTMVTERILDVLMLPLLAGFLFYVEKDKFKKAYSLTKEATGQFSNSYIFYAIVSCILLFVVYKLVTDKSWILRIKEFVIGIFSGLKSILKTENPVLFIFHSAVIWILYIGSAYISFWALPQTESLGLVAAVGVTFFGALAFAAVQGGVGAYPLVTAKFLLVFGITESIGLSLGWMMWSMQTGFVILGGLLSLLILSLINKK
jgi:glycosyltransferase 2 family protein